MKHGTGSGFPLSPVARAGFLTDCVHVVTLAGFAVAQPVFDILSGSPEFFLARRSEPADVVLLAIVLSLGVGLALVAVEMVARIFGPRVQGAAHAVLVAGLLTLVALPILGRVPVIPGWVAALVAIGLGVGLTVAYLRIATAQLVMTWMWPSIVIFPALFLLRAPMSGIVFPQGATSLQPAGSMASNASGTTTPLVMVVFDEFSVGSLLDARRRIDPVRYPNFSRLAKDSTWFRNATTVASVTQAAVAALLTGKYPGRNPLSAANRSRNLFTLFAGSHDLRAIESYVPFCLKKLCGSTTESEMAEQGIRGLISDVFIVALHVLLPREMASVLPNVSQDSVPLLLVNSPKRQADDNLRAFFQLKAAQKAHGQAELASRLDTFSRFLDSIDASSPPGLHYLHVMLPHEPSVHLPSGKICPPDYRQEPATWGADDEVVASARQRHLLQVAFVDSLIGRLIERLEAKGIYDETLLVIAADHGVSYRVNQARRALTRTNYCDILRVPLFVKAPGQREGVISDRNVELVDVLPTIADILDIRVPWATDGQSAVDPSVPPRSEKVVWGPYWPAEKGLFGPDRQFVIGPSLDQECMVGEPEIPDSGAWSVAVSANECPETLGVAP